MYLGSNMHKIRLDQKIEMISLFLFYHPSRGATMRKLVYVYTYLYHGIIGIRHGDVLGIWLRYIPILMFRHYSEVIDICYQKN